MKPDPEEGARVTMGLVMVVLVASGAALVARSNDDPMTAFGYGLMIFGVGYIVGLVRQHCDAVDLACAAARSEAHPVIPRTEAAE